MTRSTSTFKSLARLVPLWAKYNIQARYTEAKLGWLWIILRPFGVTVIYSTLFSALLNRPPEGDVPYFLFFLCGLTIWELFATTASQATHSTVGKISLMSQLNFPRESIVLVDFAERLVDFAVNFIILVIISLALGHIPSSAYLFLPLILLSFIAFTVGGAFFLAPMSVFVRDIGEIVSLLLRFLFFFSGAIFSIDMMPEQAQKLLVFNPLLVLIDAYRNVILYNEAPELLRIALLLLLSFIFLVLGFRFYKSQEGKFVDYL